jgi:transposase-like protein
MSNAEVMIEARIIKVAFSMRLDPIRQEKLQRWDGLYQCVECKKQFTVTVGTIFENSHIPLRKWLIAWYLLCSSKKGISSLQIQRMLGLGSYRTALFMIHRIRYALAQPEFTTYLKGVVEMEETYIGGKATGSGKTGRSPDSDKTCVVSLVQRGGQARPFVMDRVTAANLNQKIDEHVIEGSIVVTDDFRGYRRMPPVYDHKSISHSAKKYVRKDTWMPFLLCPYTYLSN